MTSLSAVCVMAIDLARTQADLAAWWRDHHHVLRMLPLDALTVVVAAKDRAKAALPITKPEK